RGDRLRPAGGDGGGACPPARRGGPAGDRARHARAAPAVHDAEAAGVRSGAGKPAQPGRYTEWRIESGPEVMPRRPQVLLTSASVHTPLTRRRILSGLVFRSSGGRNASGTFLY